MTQTPLSLPHPGPGYPPMPDADGYFRPLAGQDHLQPVHIHHLPGGLQAQRPLQNHPSAPVGYHGVPYAQQPEKKRKVWPFIVAPLGVLLLIIVIASAASSGSGGGSVTSTPPAGGAPAAAVPAEEPADSGVATWGQRYTWDNGMAVDVSTPEAYEANSSSYPDDFDRAVKFTITVTNGTNNPYEFNNFIFGPTATFGGEAANDITDFQTGLGAEPLSTILPGKSLTYEVAFVAPAAPTELQLEFEHTVYGDKAIFTGIA